MSIRRAFRERSMLPSQCLFRFPNPMKGVRHQHHWVGATGFYVVSAMFEYRPSSDILADCQLTQIILETC
jgi:hypothetical protein